MSKNLTIVFRAACCTGALCTAFVLAGCDGEVVGPVATNPESGADAGEDPATPPSESPENSPAEDPASPAEDPGAGMAEPESRTIEISADVEPAADSPDSTVTAAKPVADEEPTPAAAPALAGPAGGGFTPLSTTSPGAVGETPAAGGGFNPAAATKPPALGGSFTPLEPAGGAALPGPAGAAEGIQAEPSGGFNPAGGPAFNPAEGFKPAGAGALPTPAEGGGFAPTKQPAPAPATSPAGAGGFEPAREPATQPDLSPAGLDPAAAPLPAPVSPRTPAAGGIESPAPITPRAAGAGEPGVLPVPAPPVDPKVTGAPVDAPADAAAAKKDFEVRDWKDASGIYTIRGKFHAHLEEKGRVRILRPSGNTVTIGIDQLSSRDTGYVKALTNPAAQDSLRTWTDRSGSHAIQAKLLEVLPTKVRLQNEAGQNFSIGLADLSDQDQGFVEAINE